VKLNELPKQLEFTKNRIKHVAGDGYNPYLHYDVCGMLGIKYGNDIQKIIKGLESWMRIVAPYK